MQQIHFLMKNAPGFNAVPVKGGVMLEIELEEVVLPEMLISEANQSELLAEGFSGEDIDNAAGAFFESLLRATAMRVIKKNLEAVE